MNAFEKIVAEITLAREWLALNGDSPDLVRYYQRIIRNGEAALQELEEEVNLLQEFRCGGCGELSVCQQGCPNS